jgi:hypothetical protein
VNVFAAKGRDEGAMEPVHHLMHDLITILFEGLHLPRAQIETLRVLQGFHEQLARSVEIVGCFFEQVEEALLARHQRNSQNGSMLVRDCK